MSDNKISKDITSELLDKISEIETSITIYDEGSIEDVMNELEELLYDIQEKMKVDNDKMSILEDIEHNIYASISQLRDLEDEYSDVQPEFDEEGNQCENTDLKDEIIEILDDII